MSGKKTKTREITSAGNYKLKTKAIDRLVNAENAPEVSEEEINKYRGKKKFSIPSKVKIVLLKFWFAGAVCYFFLWGLGLYIHGLDLLLAMAIGLGVTTDLMANKLLRSFEKEEGENDRWMMVTVRKYWSIFLNVLYAGVLLYCVFRTYYALNILLGVDPNADITSAEAMLGVEPILFGIFYLAFDMLFIKVKNTFITIFRDAGAKVRAGER
jgi:hypothetical protein